jgi:chemotaxis family two-component system response regulator Rcp1
MSTTLSELHIMLIEDSRADAKIFERALREGAVPHRLTVVRDGTEALEYLFGLLDEAAEPDREPDLILLDINLPGIDGFQVLRRIKADPQLRILPVIILTTSDREEDVLRMYQAGANTYISKPAEYARYRELVSALRTYWLDTALKVPHPLYRVGVR